MKKIITLVLADSLILPFLGVAEEVPAVVQDFRLLANGGSVIGAITADVNLDELEKAR